MKQSSEYESSSTPSAKRHFAYTPDQLKQLAEDVLSQAKKIGATDCAVEITEGSGLTVNVRKGKVETIEQNRDKGIGVTVHIADSAGAPNGCGAVRRGNANTSDFSAQALKDTVEAAYNIARFTAADDCASLPEDDLLQRDPIDYDLFHPWDIDAEQALKIGQHAEAAAFAVSPMIRNSDGASVSAQHAHFIAANSRGFMAGYPHSRHSISVAPIASPKRGSDGMQRDDWYVSKRDPADLPSPESVGSYAAERALARMGSQQLSTRQAPVRVEAPAATGLLGAFTQAVSGGALYRQSSFLVDSIGTQVFASHVDVTDDPTILKGMGSTSFDEEGVRTLNRKVVEGGIVRGYFLSTYSARKLGMKTTGNAGGSHNLSIRSALTRASDDFPAMLKKLGTGLLVTELMGQGVNYLTGDYSRGATGFWVENGVIAYPVEEITIAANLREMFLGIAAIGADTLVRGNKESGSILIENMAIAGS